MLSVISADRIGILSLLKIQQSKHAVKTSNLKKNKVKNTEICYNIIGIIQEQGYR